MAWHGWGQWIVRIAWAGAIAGMGWAVGAEANRAEEFDLFSAPDTGKTTLKPLRSSSVGPKGIDALRLHEAPYNLTGRKIAIGQVEIGRPGLFGVDKAVAANHVMMLERVFYRDTDARQNANVDSHAQNVASVMISSAKAAKGVAPNARLFSSAAGTPRRYGQPEECLSAQHIAMQNGGDVRAINLSFGESLRHDPRPTPVLDGKALLTLCIDWSARVHNVLYVVAGNQGKGGISIPTDNYNGVNVAFTTRVDELFARVDFANIGDPASGAIEGIESNVGGRRAIALAAPGSEIAMVNPNGSIGVSSGTSFAAPHVTGTVALLQEYGDAQLRSQCPVTASCPVSPSWTLDARRAEVMKAVLLNAADKLQDTGDGLRLGMSRTIVDKANRSWPDLEAATNPAIPLNIQMGAGQLNAYRAYQQFSAGQWAPTQPLPPIGWDYHTVTYPEPAAGGMVQQGQDAFGPYRDYVLERPLKADSFVSVTLTWQRVVELDDKNQNGVYDLGEDFRDRGLNNLDLYLMRATDTDIRQSLGVSNSKLDNVEHLFQKIPATGRYKIRVYFRQPVNSTTQPYAIAWWTVPTN